MSAGVVFNVKVSPFEEEQCKEKLIAQGSSIIDIAGALARGKAREVAQSESGLVIGCDQVLEFRDALISKPRSKEDARQLLETLRGNTHRLFSAAAIYEDGKLVWTHIGEAKLTMRNFSDGYVKDYLDRNWDSIQSSVGGYKLEEEGVRLFCEIKGDYFNVLGMPLLEILEYLGQRKAIAT